MPEPIQIFAWVAGMIFSAGGAWWQFRQLRKDVNGIGIRMREELRLASKRHFNTALAIMTSVPEEKRKEVADLLKEE